MTKYYGFLYLTVNSKIEFRKIYLQIRHFKVIYYVNEYIDAGGLYGGQKAVI